ncbi:MAG: hypothetical protein K9G60_02420 [Pseudolabrys sp.]|nr:hypothetical protein [Pseudolabrys sp.]
MKARDTTAVAYIGEMSWELAKIARANGLTSISYLLEVAAREAESAEDKCKNVKPTGKGQDEVRRLQQ